MTNRPANRPSTARKVTKKTEDARRQALDEGMRLTLDEGKTWHVLRIGDVSSDLAREIRATTGHGFMELCNLLANSPDLDVVQEAVWAARRIQGERIELADVEVDYELLFSDKFDVDAPGAQAAEANSPEA